MADFFASSSLVQARNPLGVAEMNRLHFRWCFLVSKWLSLFAITAKKSSKAAKQDVLSMFYDWRNHVETYSTD